MAGRGVVIAIVIIIAVVLVVVAVIIIIVVVGHRASRGRAREREGDSSRSRGDPTNNAMASLARSYALVAKKHCAPEKTYPARGPTDRADSTTLGAARERKYGRRNAGRRGILSLSPWLRRSAARIAEQRRERTFRTRVSLLYAGRRRRQCVENARRRENCAVSALFNEPLPRSRWSASMRSNDFPTAAVWRASQRAWLRILSCRDKRDR